MGFEIVQISADKDEKALRTFLKTNPSSWTHIYDSDSALREKFNVKKFPTTFIVDEKGRIIFKDITGEDIGTLIGIMLNTTEDAKKTRLAKEPPKRKEKKVAKEGEEKADNKKSDSPEESSDHPPADGKKDGNKESGDTKPKKEEEF